MHQRDLYVVYVKQYCGSVNTFRAICFSCFEEVRGLLPIGLKLALMLYLCNFSNFFFFFGLKHLDQSDDSVPAPERITEQPWESIIFAFPWKSSVFLPFWSYIWNTMVQRAQQAWAMAGNTKGPSLLAGWFAPHTQPCSLCGQAALMLGFSYLSPGKVNEVVALFEEVKMGWVAKTRGSLEMKRGALSCCKWQFWWIT